MRTKPTNFEAAKSVITIGEGITADQIIDRMLTMGRREVPTKKAIAVKFRCDPDIKVVKRGREATIFYRVK
jgi:hypothetical protein|tara:strand:- start:24742 stop:24954 length:213 start_codon:yes stop_codon:yes gene_type:complete